MTTINFNPPGLGAWTVDIKYDNSVVSVLECEPLPAGSVCNPAYTGSEPGQPTPASSDTVRIVGAVATGLEGDTVIGRIIFQCDVAGGSNLDLSIETLADGTLGDPQLVVPFVENGAITCAE